MRIYKFDIAVTCACAGLLGFFAWHATEGPRGYAYHDRLAIQKAATETELSDIRTKRQSLEQHVALLRPESLDPDMVDEMARGTLDLAMPNEVIVRKF